MRIDFVTLRLFVAVAEETSLAKAAEREHLAASAISKRLADLEFDLNVRLFDRKPTGMFPTSAGAALLHHARLIARNVAALEAELVDFARGVRGVIRVKANATAMARYLPEDLRTFLPLYPDVHVEIEESTSPSTIKAIAENAADIGIYGDVIVPAELGTQVYRTDRLLLLVPDGHGLASQTSVRFSETVRSAYIGTPRGSSIDIALSRASADLGVTLKVSVRTSGFDAISRMVDAGLGIAVVPRSLAGMYASTMNVTAVELDEPWAERRLMICTRHPNMLTPAAAALVAHLTRDTHDPPP